MAQIIIADDDKAITDMLGDALAKRNHHVFTVADGYELLKQAKELLPDLIIADVQMPGAYGSSVYRTLQESPRTDKIPILFISAHSYERLKAVLPEDPKTRFLHKPFDIPQLEKVMAELLPAS